MLENRSLIKLNNAFNNAGYQLRIVGGAVRDYLLGVEPKDIDLCTDAQPDEMLKIADKNNFKYIPTGLQHGTVTFVVDNELFEVTTLRIDVETDGRHADVQYTRSFELDAARRDLTINAMSMDLAGNLYDYFDGKQDLLYKRVRFVGDAGERVREDYLRILRFFRFYARFGGIFRSLDELGKITTFDALVGLTQISVERYWLEMQKLCVAPYKDEVLNVMYHRGVLNVLGLEEPNRTFVNSDAIGVLSTMVRPANILAFLNMWKLSSAESKKLQFLVAKQDEVNIKPEQVEEMLVDGVPRDWVATLLQINDNNQELAKYVMECDIPQFPVTGQDLLDNGFVTGVELGKTLQELRNLWKKSDYLASKETLLNYIK